MSIFYKKSNGETAKNLFDKSLIYDFKMINPNYENLISFEFAEKYLYGRVKTNYVPMELSTQLPLSSLSITNQSNHSFQAVSFVVDAFVELSSQFDKKAAIAQISTTDRHLSKLEVQKAYESPKTLYNSHVKTIKDSVVKSILKNNIRFSNFNEFLTAVTPIIIKMSKNVPFTYSGFIKSRYCPMTVSGLVIEIAAADSANDEKKIAEFKNSPNWEFYLNACKSYGFSVDINNPWRLVADIGSTAMLQYASAYGYNTTNAILNVGYSEAQRTFMPIMTTILLEIYTSSRRQYNIIERCQDGSTIPKIVDPIRYSFSDVESLMSETDVLKLYMAIRMVEDETVLTEQQENNIMIRMKQLYRLKGLMPTVREFEAIIASTYNESGSLTDLVKRDIVRKQEEEDVLSNT